MIELYKNYKIEIDQDDYTESPLEWDNLGTIVYKNSRSILGNIEIPEDYYNDQGNEEYIWTTEDIHKWLTYTYGEIAEILPIYMYEHSGITIRTTPFSDNWDSGQMGYIFVTKEKVRKEYNVKRVTKKIIEKVRTVLEAEVRTFDTYLTGDIWGFVITDSTDNEIEGGNTGGFYGYDYCLGEAHGLIDWEIKHRKEEHEEKLKAQIRAHAPLEYR